MLSNIEVKTPNAPIYEVKLDSLVEVPKVSIRWNKVKSKIIFSGKSLSVHMSRHVPSRPVPVPVPPKSP